MEPLRPSVRQALKEAHPSLTDEEINRVEELLARRFQLDPETEQNTINELDRQREELIRNVMPRYQEVIQRITRQD